MSENFRRNWRERSEILTKEWNLRDVEWLDHESTAMVARCSSPWGPAYLKVSLLDFVIGSECLALRKFGPTIFPLVFEFSSEHQALLIEPVSPGTQLAEIYPSAEAECLAFAWIFRSMREIEPAPEGLPRIYDFADIFNRMMVKTDCQEVRFVFRKALEWREMLRGESVLHGDLHHFNILKSGDGWKAIDPHGFVGNPLYEIGAFLRNPIPFSYENSELEVRLRNRIEILSRLLEVPEKEVSKWGFFGAAFSLAWDVDEGKPITGMKDLALACLELSQRLEK